MKKEVEVTIGCTSWDTEELVALIRDTPEAIEWKVLEDEHGYPAFGYDRLETDQEESERIKKEMAANQHKVKDRTTEFERLYQDNKVLHIRLEDTQRELDRARETILMYERTATVERMRGINLVEIGKFK